MFLRPSQPEPTANESITILLSIKILAAST